MKRALGIALLVAGASLAPPTWAQQGVGGQPQKRAVTKLPKLTRFV